MPRSSASAVASDGFTVADVRFLLTGPAAADPDAFPPSFREFRRHAPGADLTCRVSALGPDPSLDALPSVPESPWLFTVRGDTCQLLRRDAAGRVLWRIVAPLAFDEAAVAWHPELFPAVYRRYEQAWGASLGLTLLVFRLRACGGLALHGAAADLDGRGVIGVGVSGSGKSTFARLLHASGASVLTDERPILRQWPPPPAVAAETPPDAAGAPMFRVHGSPWPSSAGFARPAWAPLRRLYFLEHAAATRLTPLEPQEAFQRLLHVATIPWHDPALFDPCLATVEALLAAVPCAVLGFRPDAGAVEAVRADLDRKGAAA